MAAGHVEAASEGFGHGATFTVTLPLTATRANRVESLDGQPVASQDRILRDESALPNLRGLRILTIDGGRRREGEEDEADTRDLVRTVLESCGANVVTAASAREGLDSLAGWNPHVLICDIGMPGEDGYSVIRKVRASEHCAGLPAIALTAYVRVEDRMRALEAGYQMFLPKPVEATELRSTVASVVGRT